MNAAASARKEKEVHPERFCPAPRCLWKTAKRIPNTNDYEGGGPCPNHGGRYCDCEAAGCPKHKAGGCRQAATKRIRILGRIENLCPDCLRFATSKMVVEFLDELTGAAQGIVR
jgi:hypothetical protein